MTEWEKNLHSDWISRPSRYMIRHFIGFNNWKLSRKKLENVFNCDFYCRRETSTAHNLTKCHCQKIVWLKTSVCDGSYTCIYTFKFKLWKVCANLVRLQQGFCDLYCIFRSNKFRRKCSSGVKMIDGNAYLREQENRSKDFSIK